MAGARGHVPVDGADVVAVLVLPDLVELHPAALEDGMVLARQRLVDQPVGCDLDPADLADDFFRQHLLVSNDVSRAYQGTCTASKIRLMI